MPGIDIFPRNLINEIDSRLHSASPDVEPEPTMSTFIAVISLASSLGLMLLALWWVLRR